MEPSEMSSNSNDPRGESDRPRVDPAHGGAKPADPADFVYSRSIFRTAGGTRESGPMSAVLARNWWAVLLRGIFALIFGVVAVLLPGVTIGSLVLLFGIYMLADGIFAIIAGVRAAARQERWGALVLEGVADLIAGAIALVWPLATVLAFVYLAAAWAVVSGALLLAATFRLQPAHGKWLMGLGAIVSIVWGVLLFAAPGIGAVVMTWWLGIYALLFGGALVALAFRLRGRHARP
jgi:uncharacterized membrane protein HdeD (DUF308 family)